MSTNSPDAPTASRHATRTGRPGAGRGPGNPRPTGHTGPAPAPAPATAATGTALYDRPPSDPGPGYPAPQAQLRPTGLAPGRRILVVDGDTDGLESLVCRLRRHGHRATGVDRGGAALEAHEDADLVLLDLDLVDLDGLEVCRAIRATSCVPLIVVTARGSELDRVLGLQAGADDYVVKPYGFVELMARIEAVLRRARWQPPSVRELRHGPLRIDVASREVTLDGRQVELTRKEFDLLCLLASHPHTVIPRKRLLTQVWGDTWSRRTVDTHVSSLRGKLGGSGWIVTVRGVGFRLGDG